MTKLNLGGWHPDPYTRKTYAIQWPIGSIFANEGQRLYDLVIKHKPKLVVEVGSHAGCSSAWIASALKELGEGKLISIDINENSHSLLPKELKQFVQVVHQNAFDYKVPKNIDILFEDGQHTYGFTKKVLERYPAKIVVCHDYNHWDCRATVKNDFDRFFGAPDENFFEKPSDCGLAIKYVKK